MDFLAHAIAERGVDEALAGDARLAGEGGAFDRQREVRFASAVVPGVAAVVVAFVDQRQSGGLQRRVEPTPHFGRDRSSGSGAHRPYIGRLCNQDRQAVASRSQKFHGRIEGAADACGVAGCREPGEFRAPISPGDFDGPGEWRYLCLDHVRVHNARYNYFTGMSIEEIEAAQSPIAGWERATRAFATNGADRGPANGGP